MNYSTAIFLINKAVRAVKVSYDQDKANPGSPAGNLQLFKTFDSTLAKGDYVVVPTDTRWNMTVCRVEEVGVEIDLESSAQIGWLMGRVDRGDYDAVVVEEESAITAIKSAEKRRKQEELIASLIADNPDLAHLQAVRPAAALAAPEAGL
jgi:hypothetical protein